MYKLAETHLHTQYSFLDGVGSPEEYIKKAKELNMKALACTDHGTCAGLFHFHEACRKENIKPILGIEFYITYDKELSEPIPNTKKKRKKRYHLIALAKNYKGYQNIIKLSSLAFENFNRKPILLLDDLLKHKDNLIITSACIASIIEKEEYLKILLDNFKDDFYIEVQPLNLEKEWDRKTKKFKYLLYNKQLEYSNILKKYIDKYNLKPIVTLDVHYPSKEDKIIQDIFILNSYAGKSGWHFASENHYLMDAEETWEYFKEYEFDKIFSKQEYNQMLENIGEIVEKVEDYELEKEATLIGFDANIQESKKDWLLKRIKQYNKFDLNDTKYLDRLVYELKIIGEKNFLDYFFIVEDIVRWARENNILVGPGRGSAAGSLLAYALNITQLDPIKFHLSFDRFYDASRQDPPDIDLDFSNQERVIEYLESKYGKDNIIRVGSYQTIKAKTAIKDAYRVLKKEVYNFEYINGITKQLPNFTGDEKIAFKEYLENEMKSSESPVVDFFRDNLELLDALTKMIGKVKLVKKHPCAIIISPDSILDKVPTFINHPNTKDAHRVTEYDLNYVQKSGLIKFDILSLNTLKDIQNCLVYIKEKKSINLDIYSINIEDEKVFERFNKGDLDSVFQFNTKIAEKMILDMQIDSFSDLVAITAIGRPGPLEAGLANEYIKRKRKRKVWENIHPKLSNILEKTYGVIVFQEQVMKIFEKIGGFSAIESNQIRKMISKKHREDIKETRDRFIEYATKELKPNILLDDAVELFEDLEKFAGYSFNKAHAYAYSFIGYITQYLKTYYPLEWWAAVLKNSSEDDLKNYFRKRKDIIKLPDINKSKEDFIFDSDDRLIMPLRFIKGLGPSAIREIIAQQPYKNFDDFIEKTSSRIIKKNVVGNLIIADVFSSINSENMGDLLEYYYKKRNKKNEIIPSKYDNLDDRVVLEKLQTEVFCFYSSNWVQRFSDYFKENVKDNYEEIKTKVGYFVVTGGLLIDINESIARNGKTFYKLIIENNNQKLYVYLFDKLPKIKLNSIIEIEGQISKYGLTAKKIKTIIKEGEIR